MQHTGTLISLQENELKKYIQGYLRKKIYSRLFERKTKNFQGMCEPRISVLFKSINIVSIFVSSPRASEGRFQYTAKSRKVSDSDEVRLKARKKQTVSLTRCVDLSPLETWTNRSHLVCAPVSDRADRELERTACNHGDRITALIWRCNVILVVLSIKLFIDM